MKIDGYKGIFNGIAYEWEDKGTYATIIFEYDGATISHDFGNLSGVEFDKSMADKISEAAIDTAIKKYEIEKDPDTHKYDLMSPIEMLMQDKRLKVHIARFETRWLWFCEENHIDRDNKELRTMWELAYIQGALDVLNHADVIKTRI